MGVKCFKTIKGVRFNAKDGFIFLNVTYPYDIFDAIYIINNYDVFLQLASPPISTYSLKEHYEYINKNQLEKAYLFVKKLDFLEKIPSLKYFKIITSNREGLDLEPLYKHPEVRYVNIQKFSNPGDDIPNIFIPIDYHQLKGLAMINVSGVRDNNFEGIDTLKAIVINEYQKANLKELIASKQLQRIKVSNSKIKTLDGIEVSQVIQCVELNYNRSLDDISELLKIKKSLKSLKINHCPKIKDYYFLSELKELEYLELKGNNVIDNLQFINDMPKLKTLIIDLKVEDGDLTPCLNLQHVHVIGDRKHYNLKNDNLPKGELVRGIENLELWLQYD